MRSGGSLYNFDIATHGPMMIHVPELTDDGVQTRQLTGCVDLFLTLVDAARLSALPVCLENSDVKLCTEGTSLLQHSPSTQGKRTWWAIQYVLTNIAIRNGRIYRMHRLLHQTGARYWAWSSRTITLTRMRTLTVPGTKCSGSSKLDWVKCCSRTEDMLYLNYQSLHKQ